MLADNIRNGFAEIYGINKYKHTIFPEPVSILNQPSKLNNIPITQMKKTAIFTLASFFHERNHFSLHQWNSEELSQIRAIQGIGDWTYTIRIAQLFYDARQ